MDNLVKPSCCFSKVFIWKQYESQSNIATQIIHDKSVVKTWICADVHCRTSQLIRRSFWIHSDMHLRKHQCSCNLKKSTRLSDAFHVPERCMSALSIISHRVPQSVKKRPISSALDERLTGRSRVTLFILPDLRTDCNQVRGCRCRHAQVWLIHMFCPTSAYSYWGKNKVGCIIDALTQKHRHTFRLFLQNTVHACF